jgi:hypothetical protein
VTKVDKLAVRQWDVIPRATLTLSPRLSLQTYAELYPRPTSTAR